MRKTEDLEVVHLYKSTEKEGLKRMNRLFMELSDQECDDGVDSDRRKGGVKAVTGRTVDRIWPCKAEIGSNLTRRCQNSTSPC